MKTFTLFTLLWCVPLFMFAQEHGHQVKSDVKIIRQVQHGPTNSDLSNLNEQGPDFGVQVKSAFQVQLGDKYDPWYSRPVKATILNPEDRKRPKKIDPWYNRPVKFAQVHEHDGYAFRIRPGTKVAAPAGQGLPGIEGYDPWYSRPAKKSILNPEERKRPKKIDPWYNRPVKFVQVHEHDGYAFRIRPGTKVAGPPNQGLPGIEKIDPNSVKGLAKERPHGDKFSPKGVDPYYNRPVKSAFLIPERNGQASQLKPGVLVSKIDREPMTAAESETGWSNHIDNNPYTSVKVPEAFLTPERGRDIVSIVDLGSSANILTYGEQNGAATYTWYNEDVNALTNVHRMGGEAGPAGQYSGDLCYDISFDGGMTWTNQVKVYESNVSGGQYNTDAARFPQAAVYNPEGNTDPAGAYLAFFAANLDGSNGGDWGGYSYGVGNLVNTDDTAKHLQTSDLPNGYYQGIPSGYTITRQDNVVVIPDASLLDSYTEYLGDFIFMRGEFNVGIGDYEYEKFLVPVEAEYARYLKVAFDPSGQTGYVFWCNENGSIPAMEGWQYPLIIKTEDAGETWGDVISIELGGENGLTAIKNWLPDEMIEQLWEQPVPARDEIMYSTPWWNTDIAVDAWGNPHLACAVHIAGPGLEPGFVITTPESYGIFDIYSIDDDNEEWFAVHLGTLNADHAEFANPQGEPLEDFNRVEVATTWDGSKLFFSWLDTRLDGVEENTSPDIYARGFDLVENAITDDESSTAVAGANCVTAFSEAMWQAYFKSMTPYVIRNGESGSMTYTLPLFYADMNPLNVLDPVRFKYIQDFSYSDGDFTQLTGNPAITTTGLAENIPHQKGTLQVSQNYPNPFRDQSTVIVTLKEESNLLFRVFTQAGQVVHEESIDQAGTGRYRFTLNARNWGPGLYYYNVSDNRQVITRKMIVQ